MPHLIFVYGTLKEGFPNHFRNPGQRVAGSFRTRQRFPLYVVRLPSENRAPWLVNSPGEGHQVAGQVFEVDGATLAQMDAFEEVHLPTGYVRANVELEPVDGGTTVLHTLRAHVYLKRPAELPLCLAIEGPFAEYTPELAAGYWLDTPMADGPAG